MEEAGNGKKTLPREYGRVPSRFLYSSAAFLLQMIAKPLFHVEWHVDPRIRTLPMPLVILGNHPSYLDPFLVACALYPMKINFLAAASFFRTKIFESLLYRAGVIPKTQFRADSGAIKSMLKVVRRNGVLGIFPEGARSIDGTPLPIEETIAKFIKKVGGSVVVAVSHGAYLTWPRWSGSGFRRGRIGIDIKLLFTREEVDALPAQRIHADIVHALDFHEYRWQEKPRVSFRSRAPALGLHNILHQCPSCRKRWVTDTAKTTLFCKACGNTAWMDSYGFLNPAGAASIIFRTVREWNEWQIADLEESVLKEDYFLAEKAELFVSEGEARYIVEGSGVIRLDRTGFSFHGTKNGQPVEKIFPLAGVLGISSDYGLNFDLVSDRFTYRFILTDGQKAISFTHVLELLRKYNLPASPHL